MKAFTQPEVFRDYSREIILWKVLSGILLYDEGAELS